MSYGIDRLEKLDEWLDTVPPPPENDRISVLNTIMAIMGNPDALNPSDVPSMGVMGLPVKLVIAPRTNVEILFNIMRSPPYAHAKIVLIRVRTVPWP